MKTTRTIGWALAVTIGAALGCSHESNAPAPAVATTQENAQAQENGGPGATQQPNNPPQAQPPPQPAARRMDPAAALLGASSELGLSQTQQVTVRMLDENLHASSRDLGSAFQRMKDDLASQVRMGSIDPAKVQADEAVVTSALQAHKTREVDALNGLHATLDPTQRAAVVATVRSEQPPGRAEEQAGPHPPKSSSEKLDRLTRELQLDSDQQQRVSALLSQQENEGSFQDEHQRRFDAVLYAFAQDQFDANGAVQQGAQSPEDMIHDRVQRQVRFLSQLLPVLRPDQRDKLAAHIERRDAERGHDGE